jgi:hypothetical protein
MATAKFGCPAVTLVDGRVLVAGGTDASVRYYSSAETYDPATGKFTATGPMATERGNPGAISLSDGSVLVYGGENATGCLSTAELYWP